jgi:hypothetical protein
MMQLTQECVAHGHLKKSVHPRINEMMRGGVIYKEGDQYHLNVKKGPS